MESVSDRQEAPSHHISDLNTPDCTDGVAEGAKTTVELVKTASQCNKHCRSGEPSELSNTPFRRMEKKYKLYEMSRREARRHPPLPDTDLSDVVDLHCIENNTEGNRKLINLVSLPMQQLSSSSSAPSSSRSNLEDNSAPAGGVLNEKVRCYTFAGVPGLLCFPGVLSEEEQVLWSREAILSFGDSALHPNILSTHAKTPQETSCYQPPMRWATLGYSYEWTNKVYHRDRYSTFPVVLRERMCQLIQLVAKVQQDEFHCTHPELYEPQTAIVNYYPVGSMMMCHQDVSEETLQQPLVSLSLGCSAVFLMGTQSREEAPYAFKLRSGDVVAFTGPSRTAFHSTPRILDDCPAYLTVPREEITPQELRCYRNYGYHKNVNADGSFCKVEKQLMTPGEQERYWRLCMRHMRVNINARQVYSEPCSALFE